MSGLVENYIRELFDEKNVSEENREKLWNHYYSKLSQGVDVGWNSGGFEVNDKDLVKSLKESIAEFSAFKETAFRKDLEQLMTKDGKFVPWSEFKKEAYKVSGDYNARWLETEYHQTVANANAAAQWKDFERNADLYPNLKLVSVRDARVRPEHKALDGTIRPINDPFWDTHMTPLDWGCRCHVEQTDEEPTEIKGGVQLKMEFENNPGKTGKIFGETGYENRITVSEAKEAKKNAEKWSKEKDYVLNDENIKKLKNIGFEIDDSFNDGKDMWNEHFSKFNIENLNDKISELAKKYNVDFDKKEIYYSRKTVIVNFTDSKNHITIERGFKIEDDAKLVKHRYFELPKQMQGQGFSKDMFKIWHQEYKNAGVEMIQVHANIDVGGYTWAKYGFRATEPDEMIPIFNKAKKLYDSGALSDDQYNHFLTIKDNMKNDVLDMNKIANSDYGKKLLLKSDWSGEIDLRDKKQAEKYENYLFGRK